MDPTAQDRAPARLRATPSWLLNQLATHASRLSGEVFAAVGGGRYHYALLSALEEYGPSSQAELGRRCAIDRSYVVEAVNELAAQGLAVRAPDPADRRRNIITLTRQGERKLQRVAEALAGAQDELLSPLTPAERDLLTGLLARLYDHHARR